MYKSIITVFITILSIVITSCHQKQEEYPNLETIHIDISTVTEGDINDVCDSIVIIKLDKEPLLGQIDDIQINPDFLFLLDRNRSKIFIFNHDGKYIHTLDKKGRAPDEYLDITSFHLQNDRNELIINDNRRQSVVYYSIPDLHFVKRIPTYNLPSIYLPLDSCRYFGVFAHILDQENNGCFIIKDSTQYQLPIDNNYLSMSISSCNLQNDKIYYTYNANYSIIYQIDSEQTIPLYKISYGKDQCQDENYFKNPQADAIAKFKFAFENKAYTGISLNTIVTSRNVCFNYAHKHINLSKLYTAVYNLETKQIKNYSKLTTTGISNAITPKGTYQDFYISLIIPENCNYKKENIKGELSQQIMEEIETTDFSKELCHPFVVLYKLK